MPAHEARVRGRIAEAPTTFAKLLAILIRRFATPERRFTTPRQVHLEGQLDRAKAPGLFSHSLVVDEGHEGVYHGIKALLSTLIVYFFCFHHHRHCCPN